MCKRLIQKALLFVATALPVVASAPASGAGTETADPKIEIMAPGGAPTLNAHIVVEENVVRLGDLFSNVGEKAQTAVAYAPAPGERAVLDARWLYRVAKAYRIEWQPLGLSTQSVVERASEVVPLEDIKTQILFALADRGVGGGDMDIEFASRLQQVYLPAGGTPTLDVEAIDYHDRTGRFTAIVVAASNAHQERIRLAGRVIKVIEVPVLTSRVLRGEIIERRQISWVRMNADRVQADAIVDEQDLIGMTPRRGIRTGVPIRTTDVRRPLLVEKNSLVVLIHRVPNMMLTAQGKALQSGADGDVVQIRNVRSNQVVEAEVIGPGRVAVRTLASQLSMNLN